MNIGLDIRSLAQRARTGVGEYTIGLLDALFKIDQQNNYYLFYNSAGNTAKFLPQWKQNNLTYISGRWPNKLFNLSQKLLRQPKIDNYLRQKTGRQIDWFFSPNINFTSLSKKTKYILTVHDFAFNFYPKFFSARQRIWHQAVNFKKQCQRADVILAPSQNTKNDIVKNYQINPEKIFVIYPACSSNFTALNKSNDNQSEIIAFRKKYNLPDKYILFLGAFEPRKNIIGLIEAYEKMLAKYGFNQIQHYLVLAGADGWKNKDVRRKLKKTVWRDYIKCLGYVNHQDKPKLYQLASLFVYPSFYEGFGLPVLEAMQSETPVIASNRSSLPEVTANGAILINPNKTDEITRAMKLILTDKNLSDYLINQGKIQSQKFNWQNSAEQFLKIINPSPRQKPRDV
ncbi:MAG: hypothetical protein COU31_03525 [Candidatus Magasanikbacteria bacterium CG10_big_fil_rev_8_21_14_0_10_40_10]|uniref:Glycosyltransferase family 1 protein n=1 Tax=Candidatus Magasanikbacteria bacterium CG10_big_fil_rev_8_21_14_0_10_40_10 TaxID=1974648 RepID=A0A2M6W3E0_9BACT|nr:MAG: hypothetical protein COU31_03525 [Candidatus Magasanikbacteria bacterium CG10_big_fil_rev_8_21_14_0_10_40_10]